MCCFKCEKYRNGFLWSKKMEGNKDRRFKSNPCDVLHDLCSQLFVHGFGRKRKQFWSEQPLDGGQNLPGSDVKINTARGVHRGNLLNWGNGHRASAAAVSWQLEEHNGSYFGVETHRRSLAWHMGGGVVGRGVDQILTTCSSQCGTVPPQDATIPLPFWGPSHVHFEVCQAAGGGEEWKRGL